MLGVQQVDEQDVSKYGIVDGRELTPGIYEVENLIEKPTSDRAPSNIAILGRYIISPAIFEILENTEPGAGGEIQLTDALRELAKREQVLAYEFEGRRHDVGDKLGFLQATVEFALKKEDLRDSFTQYLRDLIC